MSLGRASIHFSEPLIAAVGPREEGRPLSARLSVIAERYIALLREHDVEWRFTVAERTWLRDVLADAHPIRPPITLEDVLVSMVALAATIPMQPEPCDREDVARRVQALSFAAMVALVEWCETHPPGTRIVQPPRSEYVGR
jgi:hypothetical protein